MYYVGLFLTLAGPLFAVRTSAPQCLSAHAACAECTQCGELPRTAVRISMPHAHCVVRVFVWRRRLWGCSAWQQHMSSAPMCQHSSGSCLEQVWRTAPAATTAATTAGGTQVGTACSASCLTCLACLWSHAGVPRCLLAQLAWGLNPCAALNRLFTCAAPPLQVHTHVIYGDFTACAGLRSAPPGPPVHVSCSCGMLVHRAGVLPIAGCAILSAAALLPACV